MDLDSRAPAGGGWIAAGAAVPLAPLAAEGFGLIGPGLAVSGR